MILLLCGLGPEIPLHLSNARQHSRQGKAPMQTLTFCWGADEQARAGLSRGQLLKLAEARTSLLQRMAAIRQQRQSTFTAVSLALLHPEPQVSFCTVSRLQVRLHCAVPEHSGPMLCLRENQRHLVHVVAAHYSSCFQERSTV